MATIKDDWITKTRLSSLLRAELAVAHAAGSLAPALTSPRSRRQAEEAARSAARCADLLTEALPEAVVRRTPKPRGGLGRLLRAASALGDGAALFLLRLVSSHQARRMRWAMASVDEEAQELLLHRVLPRRMEGLRHLGALPAGRSEELPDAAGT